MREIKFRAWDGYWFFSDELMMSLNDGSLFIDYGSKRYDDAVIEQYTGLKDVNDNPVYEGDVVQKVWFTEMPDGSINTTKIDNPFEVKAGNYAYGKWIAEWILDRGFGVTNYVMPDELIILGNIHENPELLEGE